MRNFVNILLSVLIMILLVSASGAEVPNRINYQGLLMDQNGLPLNGNYELTFEIVDVTSLALWTETHPAAGVLVENGIFSVVLGSLNPIPEAIITGNGLFLVVTVAGDGPMAPMPLTSVPFAIRAAVADSVAGGGSGTDGDWVISGDNLYTAPSGNVGIGTTNPRRRLEILGDGTSGGIRWGTTYGGSLMGDIYHGGGGNGFIINSHAGGGSWADLHLQTNAITRLYVDSSGKVGVGTTTPAQMLDVNGAIQMTGFMLPSSPGIGWVLTSDVAGVGTWQPAGGSSGDGDWIVDGGNMYSSVTGNVGVGTTSPVAALHVEGGGQVIRGVALGARPGVTGKHEGTGNYGYLGTGTAGVFGDSDSDPGVYAESDSVAVYGFNSGSLRTEGYLGGHYGAYGESAVGSYGYLGGPSFAIYGKEMTNENYGAIGYWNYGVLGHSDSQVGVKGRALGGTGLAGEANSGWAVYGTQTSTGNVGYLAGPYAAVYGEATNAGPAVHGRCIDGTAGFFQGDVDIVGDTDIAGDVTVTTGRITTPVIEITGGSDLSERFDVAGTLGGDQPLPGHLVSLDPDRPGRLMISTEPYDKKVAGVISGAGGVNPGLLMGQEGSVADGSMPVALTGRVYCWADATSGAIEPGDMLTTSATAGHAMRADDAAHSHGTVIGKAMTSLDSGRGLVLVLVNLQ
jgi:hypothetical protein